MKPAIWTIVLLAACWLVMACGAPASTTPLDSKTSVAPTTDQPITPTGAAPETPADTPPQASPSPTPEPAATVVPTFTSQPSPTPAPAELPTETPDATGKPTPVPTEDPSIVQAYIVDFILPDLSLTAGATVTWTNLDQEGHTATSGKDGRFARFDDMGWDSHGLDLDESFSLTFSQPGVFPYTCVFHPFMNSTVTVVASGEESLDSGGQSSGSDYSGY